MHRKCLVAIVVLVGAALFASLAAAEAKSGATSGTSLTAEQQAGVLEYQEVLRAKQERRHQQEIAAAQDQARRLSNHHVLVVVASDRNSVASPYGPTEVNLTVVLADPSGTPVARLRPDQGHENFVAFDPDTGGLNLTEKVRFELLDEPASDPTQVSSWVTPVTLEEQTGTWVVVN